MVLRIRRAATLVNNKLEVGPPKTDTGVRNVTVPPHVAEMELMSRIGHTSPTMAMRYQIAAQERDAAIADKLSELAGFAPSAP